MEPNRESIQEWVLEQLATRLTEVFEAMTGQRPEILSVAGVTPGLASDAVGLHWRQPFQNLPGAVWIMAAEKDWTEAGNQVLRAAGIEDGDEPTLRSTYLETLGQALSGIAGDFSGKLGSEVTCATGENASAPSSTEHGPAQWTRFSIQFQGESSAIAEIVAGIEPKLLDSLVAEQSPPKAAAAGAAAPTGSPAGTSPPSSGYSSKTFDLLLDVELPVSVSFGRAQVALKDVIKLTTGAIVELNRSISEPVEVIVNNCVIARGEVVVVEGNFGVKIREVISRQDRLRTLN